MPNPTGTSRWNRDRLALTLTLVLAAAIRLYNLDHLPFWIDEGASGWFAALNLRDLMEVLPRESNPALFYLLAKGWLLFGQSDLWARLLPFFLGLAGVGLTHLLGREVWQSKRAGLVAAGLAAISPLLVMYSQEFKGYTLLYALTVACLYLLWSWSARGGWAKLAGLALLGAAGFYTHYLFCLYLAGLSLSGYTLIWPDRKKALGLTLGLAGCLLLCLPGVYVAWLHTQHMAGSWWLFTPRPGFIQMVVGSLSFRSAILNVFLLGTAVQTFIALAFLLNRSRSGLALLVFAYMPILWMLIVSYVFEPVLLYRGVIPSVAPVLILAGGWLARKESRSGTRAMALIIGLVLVTGSTVGLYEYFFARGGRIFTKPDWRTVTARVVEGYTEGDMVVLCPPHMEYSFSWYLKKTTDRRIPRKGFPFDYGIQHISFPTVPDDLENQLRGFHKNLGRPQRVWVLTLDNIPRLKKALVRSFDPDYEIAERIKSGQLALRLMVLKE